MMKFRFHPSARREYVEAAKYYDKEERGLGARFISSIESKIENIVRNPTAWPLVKGDVRKFTVNVFPFSILYAIRNDEVFIVAVAHQKRNPVYWENRID